MTPPLPANQKAAIAHLKKVDPILGEVIDRVGACTVVPEAKIDLFQALLRSIIYQQLHGNAAAAIHARVLATMGGKARALGLEEISDKVLRGAGLSGNKPRHP